MARAAPLLLALIAACTGDVTGESDGAPPGDAARADAERPSIDALPAVDASPCPDDMVLVGAACMDLYEAPNQPGGLPLVMYTFDEAAAWCAARDKRLCYDDEWLAACAGDDDYAYPYGDTRVPGQCNDDETWLTYNQTLLNGWPWTVSTPDIESLAQLFEVTRAAGTSAAAAADHVESLYQGEAAGDNPDCVGAAGVYDLVGNVEEWTRRRTSSDPDFEGNLKGRYWAESRTCQSGVTTHGDGFRFYEIGFRCCRDPGPGGGG